jgi:hypothetical protein
MDSAASRPLTISCGLSLMIVFIVTIIINSRCSN